MNLRQQFDRDGYVVVHDAVDAATIGRLRDAATRMVAEFDIDQHRSVFRTDDQDNGRDEYFFDSAERAHCFLEAGAIDETGNLTTTKELSINKIGHGMHDVDDDVAAICRSSGLIEPLRELGWQDPVLQQTMYIFKQPSIGGEVRWHQDASYLMADGRGVLGMWLALEPATRDNGCLWMQPGEHRGPLRERYVVDWQSGDAALSTIDDTPWERAEAVPLEVPTGSLVLFSDHMPHYSAPNLSDRSRHAFTMHIRESTGLWATENWLQRRTRAPFHLYG